MTRLLTSVLLLAASVLAGGTASAQRPRAADPMYTQMRNSALSHSARDFDMTPRRRRD